MTPKRPHCGCVYSACANGGLDNKVIIYRVTLSCASVLFLNELENRERRYIECILIHGKHKHVLLKRWIIAMVTAFLVL